MSDHSPDSATPAPEFFRRAPAKSPTQRAKWVILSLFMIGGAIGLFLLMMLAFDESNEPESNGARPAPAEVPDEERNEPDVADGDPADRTTTTLPNGVPSEIVGQWTQTQQIDVATGAVVDVVIGEALRLDIAADGTFTQQLGDADPTEPQILRAIQDGDDLQLLVYADEAKLAEGEHRLAADVELGDDTMEWTFGEESTLVFDRE